MNEASLSRRSFLKTAALVAGATAARRVGASPAVPRTIQRGPFQPNWESLASGYRCPDWFRDAKFGIWAHWTAQCVPEQGDWYARRMYLQGDPQYEHHLKTYGHPSKVGFMEMDRLWTADRWEPERLMDLYRRAGAKYFFALANHHDNFDAFASKHHAWNSLNVGPKRDLVGEWGKCARSAGLRFGVTNHSAHTWHWFQPAYGYDPEGPLVGVRYDAYRLRKADGKGKWWEGLDPQELYAGPSYVLPDGIRSIADADAWHKTHDRVWDENPPAHNPAFTEHWFRRCQDLVDSYRPDVLYFDDTGLPLGQAGLDITAHFYNSMLEWTGGRLDAVVNAKKLPKAHRPAVVEDIERGVQGGLQELPWQTDTCIGDWHYKRSIFEQHQYKTVEQVVHMLVDIVSKNGNLMLNVPVRGNGTIDEDEVAFLQGLAEWMNGNEEGIFGTRPWVIYGEGPSTVGSGESGAYGGQRDVRSRPYTAQDVRFTTKGNTLYAFLLGRPEGSQVTISSLAKGARTGLGSVERVELLNRKGQALPFKEGGNGLTVSLPGGMPGAHAFGLRISGLRLG